MTCSIVSAAAIVALEDYGHGAIADVDIVGMGADGNATHGILTMVTDDTEHVIERMRLERISVRDVGSYGIGMQYCGVRGCVVRDIDIKNTGSDGIDWKIRGPNGQKTPSESVVFDTISIRTFGVRLPGGSSTGIGLRGMAQLKNISIFDIGPGQVGLALMPGINAIATADLRRSAIYAEVNGVYVEGRGPRQEQPAIGVQAYAVDRCIISGVVARHCTISDQVAATSPPAPLHGPVWRNLMITPPHGAYAAMTVSLHRSSVELVVQSDYDWFDVRAGTATVGQTVFVLPLGAPTAGYAVIRNQTKLALGVGYTISGGTITLANPMGATDTVCVVYPPERAIRVNGDSCVITGECDEFCSYGVNYATAQNVATGNNLGFTWRNRPSLNKQATASAQLLVTSPNTDEDLRLIPQGAGRVRVENGLRLGSTTCPTGTFTTVDGKTVTITGGVVVGIS
ncbi:hypothetical protein EBL87_09020 [Cereibacter sphaeroides]|nr:hypothetical protein EBL87_09020 [Cereibacter sphaeroides]